MGKAAGRVIMWLVSFMLFLAFGIVAKGMLSYGRVDIKADPGVVYSSEEGNIVTSAVDDKVVINGAVSYRDSKDMLSSIKALHFGLESTALSSR